ncbi:hypothetical protein GOBAR_AA21774 [Gossypium barbadense]|uniref:RNase H type-1 domain-containing protein n=1 Tax=Gossypium barbadense TaxID=3634 RepID=A0A2P5X6D8_GOSBA|nr:hypothetical protein GOBAR_AA21774 [Gossypium barbadense]
MAIKMKEKHIPLTFAAKVIVCLHAVCLGLSLGFSNVIIKSDSLAVLRKHVLRGGNAVVDLLANVRLTIGMGSYMCNGVPNFAKPAMECDRRSSNALVPSVSPWPFCAQR